MDPLSGKSRLEELIFFWGGGVGSIEEVRIEATRDHLEELGSTRCRGKAVLRLPTRRILWHLKNAQRTTPSVRLQ